MQKFLCVTDSLGLPRPGVAYEETWVELVRREYPQSRVLTRSERASTTNTLLEPDSFENFCPDISITQLGITDCAPRYFGKFERRLLRAVPSSVRSYYMSALKKVRRRRKRRRYVTTAGFRSNINRYYTKTESNGCQVASILIAPPTAEFIEKNPNIDESIETYNTIYREVAAEYEHVRLVEPFEGVDIESVMLDEHHPDPEGHRVIFRNLSDALDTLVSKEPNQPDLE